MKLYLSPSNQPANKYAVGGTTEKEQMEAVALLVQEKLKDYEIEVVMADFNKTIKKSQRPTEAKNKGCDFYLAIHSNATGSSKTATGAVGLYHPNSPKSIELSRVLVEELNAICPHKSNRWSTQINGMTGLNGGSYGEIRSPYDLGVPSTLIEVNFHDNPQTAQWIIDNKDLIAETIVEGLVKVFNLKKKEIKEVKEMKEVYNKIEEIPTYARRTIEDLVDKGYLNGDTKGDLGLTLDMIRVFVVHDRAGLYNR